MSRRLRSIGMLAIAAGLLGVGFLLFGLASAAGFAGFGLSIGTAMLAVVLGARHAFDADHISAIDNTTRRLLSDGKPAASVGFFFALGHSTVVFLLTIIVGSGIHLLDTSLSDDNSTLHTVAQVFGAVVSTVYLLVIAMLNASTIGSLRAALRRSRSGQEGEGVRSGASSEAPAPGSSTAPSGLATRLLAPFWKHIDAAWKIYPVGFVFGLGFDTATEIGLLVITARSSATGLPLWAVLSLPLLFTGAMCAVDVIDSMAMNAAYSWASGKPERRLRYDIVITGISVGAALLVAAIQLGGLVQTEFGAKVWLLSALSQVDSEVIGAILIAVLGIVFAVLVVHSRRRAPRPKTPAGRRGARPESV